MDRMKPRKVSVKKHLAIGLSAILATQSSLAQFEDEFSMSEPEDTSMESGNSADAAKEDNSTLKKNQKEKLAKANPEDITDANFPETIDSFDFPNAEITDVIKAISELTGKNFIIDPGVRGKITIVAPTKITVAEAYKAFLSALAINGLTVVPSGGFLKIKSARNAQTDNIETYSGAYFPNTDQMITRIIHLKHISANQVNNSLRNLVSKDGIMYMYEPTNSIILSDYGSNIERVMKIINQLDVQGFEEQLQVIPIKYAKAKDLAELIDKIVNKGEKKTNTPSGGFSAGVPRFGRTTSTSQQGTSYFMVFPDDRTNALIAVGNKAGIERLKKLITQLDFRIRPEDAGGVNVYYVKNGDAEKIAQTLSGIAKESTQKPTSPLSGLGNMQAAQSQPIFGGDVKITADKTTNSLVITASKQDYEIVRNLLAKLDIPRDQVYVEAIIMEMAIGGTDKWGIGYYNYDSASKGIGRVGFNGGVSVADVLNPIGGEGSVLAFGSGSQFEIDIAGKTQKIPSLIGFINFLKDTGKANILSTPQLMVMDNQEAEIEVGDSVPTSLTKTVGATGQESVTANFQDATIKLKIKPFVSPTSNQVRMEVEQNSSLISNVSLPKALQESAQPLSKRKIKTNISVNNGDTAVLGGLMKDSESESISKVPILGDIPIIGWLFKSRKLEKSKTNLLVFLTPKVIRNENDNSLVLNEKLDERIDFIRKSGGKDPYGRKTEALRAKTARAGSPAPQSEPIISEPSLEQTPTEIPMSEEPSINEPSLEQEL